MNVFFMLNGLLNSNIHSLILMHLQTHFVLAATTPPAAGDPSTQINNVLNNILAVMKAIGAAVCAIGIAIGGFMRATAFGNERKISDSNTAITCAVVGLVIVLLASTLGTWVSGLVTGQ